MSLDKKMMSYDELKTVCYSIVDKIGREEDEPFTEVVAISRGGLTAAHIISKELNLDVGIYLPKVQTMALNADPDEDSKILFVEDLVAEGRTYRELRDFMATVASTVKYEFCPILVDADYVKDDDDTFFKYYGMQAKEWVVFPYEDEYKVVVGDRGLHRDGSDSYGALSNEAEEEINIKVLPR